MEQTQCLVLEKVLKTAKEINCMWTIPNAINVCLLCETTQSPAFPPEADILDQYRMQFSSANFDSRRNRAVNLTCFAKTNRAVRGFFRCKIISSDGKNERSSKGMINKESGGAVFSWDISSFFLDLLTQHPTILSNGSLTLSCTIIEMDFETSVDDCEPQILEQIIKGDGLKPNVIVKTRIKDIPCHKAALCTSVVFEKMFDVDMKESNEMIVDLTHVEDTDAVEDLIFHLYTKLIPSNIEDSCEALLPLADLHDLKDLKANCQLELVKKLEVDNALHMLQKATTYKAEWLKKRCVLFIKGNLKAVKESEACKTLPADFIANILLEMFTD